MKIDNLLNLISGGEIHYSQEGEDIILDRFMEEKKKGFYIDIGAHHPVRFSNTYKFYLNGWRGINIDANSENMKIFNRKRPRDININMAISDKVELLTYYMFTEPALNTLDKNLAKLYSNRKYKIIKKIKIKTSPLSDVLNNSVPNGTFIDFMSIDVEGFDYKVLKSNDWEKYKPMFIITEVSRDDKKEIKSILKSNVTKFLKTKGYVMIARTYNSIIYKKFSEANDK